jgi:predicted TIM-barrel fold metal-dependent hydrolase
MSSVDETSGDLDSRLAIERLKDYTVVDCDIHEMNFDASVFAEYMDEPHKSKAEHLLKTDDPLTPPMVGSSQLDFNPDLDHRKYPRGMDKGMSPTSPDGVKQFMDRFHTDYAMLHGHQILMTCNVPDRDYATAMARAYNDLLLDRWLDEHEGLKAGIKVAAQDPHAAAEEIDRLADEKDMVTVHLSMAEKDLFGDPKYEPIFDAASEHGLPIDMHPGEPNEPWAGVYGGETVGSCIERMTALGQHIMAQVSSVIWSGLPEKYPDMDFVFLEAGVTWLPWMMGAMDKNYERRKHTVEWLEQKPSEYLRESCWIGTQPIEDPSVAGPANLNRIFEMIDAKNMLMYATDFPHFDFDYPSMLTFPGLDEETERRILGENAADVYGL